MKAKTSKPGSVTLQKAIQEAEKEIKRIVDAETDPMLRVILGGRIDLSIPNIADSIEKGFIEGSVIKGSDGSIDSLQSTITTDEATRFMEFVRHALEKTKAIWVSQRDYQNDPAREGERIIARHDAPGSMDARTWLKLTDVLPKDAAMVLCRLNPLQGDDPERIYVDDDKSSPERYRLLLRVFEDVARTSTKHRTLMEWRAIAQERGLHYHSWIDDYVAASSQCDEKAQNDTDDAFYERYGADPTAQVYPVWQKRLNEIADEMKGKSKLKRYPTKCGAAKVLSAEIGEAIGKVLRRTRKGWGKK